MLCCNNPLNNLNNGAMVKEFAEILRYAAHNHLLEDVSREEYNYLKQEFSCLTLTIPSLPFDWITRRKCQAWYSQQFDMSPFLVPDHIKKECGKESQNVRFMFMLFAAYLAEEEFAEN